MTNVFCINTNLSSVEKLVKEVKSDLDNLLNEKQIALLWNKWVELDHSNIDKLPTSDDIKSTYGILANKEIEDFRNSETLSEKSEILDVIQYYYFEGLFQATGKPTVSREDVIKYQKEIFEQIPEILRESGMSFVADDFENYKKYFEATRLNKFQIPDVDLDVLEGKQKDTIGENSSIYTDNKENCSDDVVYLIASLTTDETVFGLPKPVNFDQTWNIIQNLLGNSTNLFEQINKLIESNEPFVPQLLQKLGVVDNQLGPETKDNTNVRTSFLEAFAKQQQDISITPVGLKNSFSAIDGQEKTSFRDNAKSLFRASKFAHKVNGKTVLNKEEYKKMNFDNTPESLKEFLSVFGINIQGEMTPDIVKDAIKVRELTNKYLINNELEWLDFQDRTLNVSSRVMNIIETQLSYVKKNKNLSVKNAEGKKQSAQSNHNYFSKLFSKLLNKIIKPTGALEKLISNGEVELNLVSGAQTQDRSEAFVFNKLSFTDIVTTTITNMFSNTPIIQLPRTSDKSSERSMKMLFTDKNANMAYTDISNRVLQNLYDAFQSDLNQTFSDKWKYGAKDAFAFWKGLGLEEVVDPSGEKYFETFKTKILEYVQAQREETIDLFQELGVINLGKKQINFTDSAWNKMSGTFEEKLEKTVDNFNFNSLYFGILYTQMTQGSMSGTTIENMFKRFAGPVAEARTTRADALKVNYLNEDFKKLGLDKFDAKYLKVYVHAETEQASEDQNLIAEIYKKNNVDDAQGIMLLPMYKVTLEMTNQWLPKQEELYQKIMKGEQYDKKEFKSTFPPIKPVGQCVIEIDGSKVPIYIKTAVYPISPADTKGLENEDKYNFGIANGIGLYIPKSGIKMTTPKKLNPIYDEKGNINENTVFDFPMEYFGIQLDINPKTTTKQLIGTQIRKLLTTNLFKQGKAVNPKYKEWVDKNIQLYEDLSKIETDKLYEAAGIELVNGEPKIINFNKLKDLVTDELLSRNMPINVINSLRYIIDSNGNLNGNTIDSLPARQKIMNLLNAIVTNRLIKLNTNGTALVQISQQGWKMKKIADPTDANILATETAISFVSDAAKLNYYKKGGLQFFTKGERTGEAEILIPYKYRHYVKPDGTFDEKLLVSIGYRIPTQGHNSMLHLKVVGYLPEHLDQVVVMPKEITSQGGSDFDVDKINLFLPNSIIINNKTKAISMDMNPEEIYETKKEKLKKFLNILDNKISKEYDKLFKSIGKDAAVDKLLGDIFGDNAFEGEFTEEEIKDILEENGFSRDSYDNTVKKIEKLNNLDNKEEWIQNFKSKQLQNEIINQTVEILEDPIVYAALTNPNNSDDLKADAARVDKKLGSKAKKIKLTYNNLFKGITLLKTTYQMFAAKALVGVFASQSTHHSLAQQVGLHFKTGRKFFFDHNTVNIDGEFKPSLSDTSSQEYIDLVESEKQGKIVKKQYEISDALGNNKLTAAVDAAKDDYLTSLGINLQTGDVFALGDRLGVNPYYMAAWINQPIIQDYLNLTKSSTSMTAKSSGNDLNKRKIIEEVIKNYKPEIAVNQIYLQYLSEKYNERIGSTDLFNNREEAGNYSVEQLEDAWFNNKGTKEMALHLLDDFLYFEDASAVIRQSISTSKFDTAGPGKDVLESTLLEMKYQDFVNKMNDDFGYTLATIEDDKEINNTNLKQETVNNLIKNIFPNTKIKQLAYHGTIEYGFEKFDNEKLGKNTNASSAKKGHFFASNKEAAKMYIGISIMDEIREELMKAYEYTMPDAEWTTQDQEAEDLYNNANGYDYSNYPDYLQEEDYNEYKKYKEELLKKEEAYKKGKITEFELLEFKESKPNIKKWIIDKYESFKFKNNKNIYSKMIITHLNEIVDDLEKDDMGRPFRPTIGSIALRETILDAIRKKNPQKAKLLEKEEDEALEKLVYTVILNSENPLEHDYNFQKKRIEKYTNLLSTALKENNDSVILKNTYDPIETDIFVMFNPEQIHILNENELKMINKSEKNTKNIEAPYANIVAKTLLNVFYKKSFNFVNSIYHDLVALHKNYYVEEAVKGLIYPTGANFVTKPADSQQASKIYGAVINYLIQSQIPLNHSLVYGDNTVHHRIINIQNNPNHPLYNNDVIQSFFNVELSGNDGIPSVSAPKNKSITTDEAGAFTRAFEEIQFLDSKLYNDLVTIAMYQTGILQSPTSFYNYLPVQTVIPLVSKAIKDAMPEDSTKIARAVIANIKMDNLQRVSAKEGDSLVNGKLILADPSRAKNKIFISYTQYVGQDSFTKQYEDKGSYFQEIEPKNHKQLFLDLRDNAETVEEVGVTDEELPFDESPFKEDEETENEEVEQPINKEIKPNELIQLPYFRTNRKNGDVEILPNSEGYFAENQFGKGYYISLDKPYVDNSHYEGGKQNAFLKQGVLSINPNEVIDLSKLIISTNNKKEKDIKDIFENGDRNTPLEKRFLNKGYKAVIRVVDGRALEMIIYDLNLANKLIKEQSEFKGNIDDFYKGGKYYNPNYSKLKITPEQENLLREFKETHTKEEYAEILENFKSFDENQKLIYRDVFNLTQEQPIVETKTAWDSLEDWQKEQLSKIITPEHFNTFSKEKQDSYVYCNTKK